MALHGVSESDVRMVLQQAFLKDSGGQQIGVDSHALALENDPRRPRFTNRRASAPLLDPTSPTASRNTQQTVLKKQEYEEIYMTLRSFVNQYLAAAFFQALLVLMVVILDVFERARLLKLSAAGTQLVATLDVISLLLFSMEVAVDLGNYGWTGFMHHFVHKVDLGVCTASWTFFIIEHGLIDSAFGSHLIVSPMDVLRSLLRLIRLVVIAVHTNAVLQGKPAELRTKMKRQLTFGLSEPSDGEATEAGQMSP